MRPGRHATDSVLGTGRFVLLYDEDEPESWGGPFRIVSLMSREAVDELRLEVGTVAVASIKSTNVIIGTPGGSA